MVFGCAWVPSTRNRTRFWCDIPSLKELRRRKTGQMRQEKKRKEGYAPSDVSRRGGYNLPQAVDDIEHPVTKRGVMFDGPEPNGLRRRKRKKNR